MEMHCWSCKRATKTEKDYVEYVSKQMMNLNSRPVKVTYCSECNAILSPKRKTCDVCGKYRRVFRAGVHTHAGGTFIPICKQCMSQVYTPFVQEMFEERKKKGKEGGKGK